MSSDSKDQLARLSLLIEKLTIATKIENEKQKNFELWAIKYVQEMGKMMKGLGCMELAMINKGDLLPRKTQEKSESDDDEGDHQEFSDDDCEDIPD